MKTNVVALLTILICSMNAEIANQKSLEASHQTPEPSIYVLLLIGIAAFFIFGQFRNDKHNI